MIIAIQALIFFRESILFTLNRFIRPYYKRISESFSKSSYISDDEDSDEAVFATYCDDKGVVFFPPMYIQRYAAVFDCLVDERWCGRLEKVVDLGYHDVSFITYLKDVPGVKNILGVDLESMSLKCASTIFGDFHTSKINSTLHITLFEGNAADPDYRLIGCDAVIAIEMIEHMLPQDLERLVHSVFGFVKPWIAVVTTPNADFNVLFKSLERNGLRRMDHLFEWTREQFNDWCTNIVTRYPQYTVTCRGIGPGPAGTQHLGCCSQLALFVSKNYMKQPELNPNSLVMVTSPPKSNKDFDDSLIDGITESNELIAAHSQNETASLESVNNLSPGQSSITLILTTSMPIEKAEYIDKSSQCNIDIEMGRSYLMFNYEDAFKVMTPRNPNFNKVYEIEDLTSRLNCTTFEVKKFTKTTQSIMCEKNLECTIYTKDVIDDITQITKMLNLNKTSEIDEEENESHMWNNINWGENAPYWNQYYKEIHQFNYPNQKKSDEEEILDIILNEVNCFVDSYCDSHHTTSLTKAEIPLIHLMHAVQHITEDVDKVKDLLDWNGYEIVGDMVSHRRVVSDDGHENDFDDGTWQYSESISDWESMDINTASQSEVNTIDSAYARYIKRVLERKVQKLRSLLSAPCDDNISTELDRVVCRLMKISLVMSRKREKPPSIRWMYCKLLDLLSLSERAIERRKKRYIETYPLMALCDADVSQQRDLTERNLSEFLRDDNATNLIMEKYRQLTESPGYDTSDEIDPCTLCKDKRYDNDEGAKLNRTRAWVDQENQLNFFETVEAKNDIDKVSNDDSTGKNSEKNVGIENNINLRNDISRINSISSIFSRMCESRYKKSNYKIINIKKNNSRTIMPNNFITMKKIGYHNKILMTKQYDAKKKKIHRRILKKHKNVHSTASKPIPESLIKLCNPDRDTVTKIDSHNDDNKRFYNNILSTKNIAATEKFTFVEIVMPDGGQETIAFHRTLGTDADMTLGFDQEAVLERIISVTTDYGFYDDCHISAQNNNNLQTIFLHDINEPTTSKGIRSFNVDAQCGTDLRTSVCSVQSATSLSSASNIFSRNLKINDSLTNLRGSYCEFGTSTNDIDLTIAEKSLKIMSVGIIIKDSEMNVMEIIDGSSKTKDYFRRERENSSEDQKGIENITGIYVLNTSNKNSKADLNIKYSDELKNIIETKLGTQNIKDSGTMTSIIHSFDKKCAQNQFYVMDEKKILLSYDIPSEIPVTKGEKTHVTQLLKPPSDLKIQDSNSVFYESSCGLLKSPLCVVSNQSNELQIKKMQVFSSKSSCSKSALGRGGVQIHSYKEKHKSEDIMYQGKWQRMRPNTIARRKAHSMCIPKETNETAHVKKRLRNKSPLKKIANCMKRELGKFNCKKIIPVDTENLSKAEKAMIITKNRQPTAGKNLVTSAQVNVSSNNLPKISTKNVDSSYKAKHLVEIKRQTFTSPCSTNSSKHRLSKKNYIPLYLKSRLQNIKNNDFTKCSIKYSSTKDKNKNGPKFHNLHNIDKSIKNDLTNFQGTCEKKWQYFVFSNEIENKKLRDPGTSADNRQSSVKSKNLRERKNSNKIPVPQSTTKPDNSNRNKFKVSDLLNASGCSSPNSIVSLKDLSNKINRVNQTSDSLDKTYLKDVDTKEGIILQTVIDENKENISQTNINSGRIKEHTSGTKKNFELKGNCNELLNKKLSKSLYRFSGLNVNCENNNISSSQFNLKIISNPNPSMIKNMNESFNLSSISGVKDTSVDENNEGHGVKFQESIEKFVRKFIEERIQDITIVADTKFECDDDYMYLIKNELLLSEERSLSPLSFKTVIENYDESYKSFEQSLQCALNQSLENSFDVESVLNLSNSTKVTSDDIDFLSFQSTTSGYVLAENKSSKHTVIPPTCNQNMNSLQDVFERKDSKIPVRPIAHQAFSGLSMPETLEVSKQPDYVNVIDSETGSIARQTASEELLVSGEFSSNYESCIVDDLNIVPDWLFNIMNQHNSDLDDEEESPEELYIPMEMPMPRPYEDQHGSDINGNIVNQRMASSGAGDGCGIHSVHSLDSSGRGTSSSSADTSRSSGQPSETILIDLTALTGHYEMLRETARHPPIPTSTRATSNIPDTDNVDGISTVRRSNCGIGGNDFQQQSSPVSDVEADISSMETDVPDLSD